MSIIYCTYLTIYKGNKLPPFYIGSSSVDKVENGYRGSVNSKKYGILWNEEIKLNPHLFVTKIVSIHKTREEALIRELYLHNYFNVVKSSMYINMSLATINGHFGRDVSKENNPFYGKSHNEETRLKISTKVQETFAIPEMKLKLSNIQKEVQNRPEERLRNSLKQKEAQNRPEVKEAKSKRAKELFSNPIIKTKHKNSCNTTKFKEAQSKDKLGSKFVYNPETLETVRTKDYQNYIDKGWKFGLIRKDKRSTGSMNFR